MKKNILITGYRGNLSKKLIIKIKKNSNIFVTKNRSEKLYLLNKNLVEEKKKIKFDTVYHFASRHKFPAFLKNSKKNYKINIKIFNNIFNLYSKNKIKYFYFLSSIDAEKIMPNDYKFDYVSSKLKVERKLKKLSKKIDHVIILRLPGVLSKNNNIFINKIIKKIKKNIKVDLKTLPNRFNAIISETDIIKFVTYKKNIKKKFDIINFACSEPFNFLKILELIKKKFNSKSKISYKFLNSNGIININKLKKNYNFKPNTTENALNHYLKSF